MFKLQENYIASLEDLRVASEGDSDKKVQIEAAIEVAEEQQNRLQKLLRRGGGQGGGDRFRGGPAEKFLRDKQGQAMQATAPAPSPAPSPVPSTIEPTPAPSLAEPEPVPTPPATATTAVPTRPEYPVPPADASGKPMQNTSGTVPAVMASIAADGQPGLKAQHIQKWGPLQQEGAFWTVQVDYMADSIFGVFPARAKAFIQQNKVVKWETLPR